MTRLPWTITAEMFLSETEVERLLARVRGTHRSSPRTDHPTAVLDRVIIELLLFSGLRTSECCGCKPNGLHTPLAQRPDTGVRESDTTSVSARRCSA